MLKKTIVAGLLGALVLMAWTFVVDGIFGFRSSIDMKEITAEREVYSALKTHITEPGRYICNPELTGEQRFPDGEPVFSILYSGISHDAAGRETLFGLMVFLLAPLVGAWLLSQTSDRVLSSFPRKILFFTGIGLLFALYADLIRIGIGGYPATDALLFTLYHVIAWTLVGVLVAWRMKPARTVTASR
jgi:hypothetical protein